MSTVNHCLYAIFYTWNRSRSYLLLTLFIQVIVGFMPLASVWIIQTLINEIILFMNSSGDIQKVLWLFGLQMAIVVLGYGLQFILQLSQQKATNLIGLHLKGELLQKAIRLPYITFEHPSFYNESQRVMNSHQHVLSMVRSIFTIMSALITVVSLLIYMVGIHWGLAVILILFTLPVLWIELFFGGARYQLNRMLTANDRREMYVSDLVAQRDSLKEIRLYGIGNYLLQKWRGHYVKSADEKYKLLKQQVRWEMAGGLLMTFAYVCCGLFIVFLIFQKKLVAGTFVAVLQAVQNIQSGFQDLTRECSSLYETSLYIDEMRTFQKREEETHDQSEEGASLLRIESIQSITLENLSFTYPNMKTPAIEHIQLHINQGERIALVGDNGSGKTTLIKCLTGLYDPDQPNMQKVNGESISTIDKKSYHARMAVLFQDFMKYEFTVKENIGFGRIDEIDNEERMISAARQAGIEKRIHQMEETYDAQLGRFFEEGHELSGGQWQKLAMARTFFRESDFIILDEPTSALDPLSEISLIRKLFNHTQDQGVLFITHRMGAARLADRIIVMKDGAFVEEGNHEELMVLNGEYKRLYEAQSQLFQQKEMA
ncbi:ABC transporter ATP-binding protein [Bacillus pumilus]|uniref:ABC transporter ATP-binding protein n=1 Tax=Bacillus pumilus TaxID=1408 RepID=A0AAD0HQU1_BACPU|nr:ABC transporter ATP-binding protein [Bacillus pumilus]AVM25697.1 ABC transporter ATP-binding protein [Bacillus pumilus]TYS41720.1 ABC transporter ATP-binding protein [Bacillus pumilus]